MHRTGDTLVRHIIGHYTTLTYLDRIIELHGIWTTNKNLSPQTRVHLYNLQIELQA